MATPDVLPELRNVRRPSPPRSKLPDGPRAPTIVQSMKFMRSAVEFLTEARNRYGEPFTLQLLGLGTVAVVSEPESMKQLVTGDSETYLAGEANAPLAPVMGRHSVILLDRAAHMEQRRLLLPPLHGDRLQRYTDLMSEIAVKEIRGWTDTKAFPLLPRMLKLTLHIILDVAFGLPKDDPRLARMHSVLPTFLSRAQILVSWGAMSQREIWPFRPRARFLETKRELDKEIYDIVAERRRQPNLDQRGDVLSMLCEATHEDGSPMSDHEIRDELLTLVMTGHDTTGNGLSWTMELLMRNPAVMSRLRDELDAGDQAYVQAVIRESLRIRPVLPAFARVLTAPQKFSGRTLPADSAVIGAVALLHHRDDIYPEPEVFRPERFIDGDISGYRWMPFGGGIRRCIGASLAQLEMRYVLPHLVRAPLELASKKPDKMLAMGVVLKPARGVRVRLTGPTNGRVKTTAPAADELSARG
jgi:cytochrome P450 family 135